MIYIYVYTKVNRKKRTTVKLESWNFTNDLRITYTLYTRVYIAIRAAILDVNETSP